MMILSPEYVSKLQDAYKALTFLDYALYGMVGTALLSLAAAGGLLILRYNGLLKDSKVYNEQNDRQQRQLDSIGISNIENDMNYDYNITKKKDGDDWKHTMFLK